MAAFPISVVPHRLATAVRTVVGGVPATVAVVFGALILLMALFLNRSRQRYALRATHCAFGVTRGLVNLTPSQFTGGLDGAIRPGSGDCVVGHCECGSWLRPAADWPDTAPVLVAMVVAVVSISLTAVVSEPTFLLGHRQPTLILLRRGG